MKLVRAQSLSATVDAVNEAFFFGRRVPQRDGISAARFIVRRFGQPGAYAGAFALFNSERQAGISAFTGERLVCAAARHIISQESCRALRLLDIPDPALRSVLEDASNRLQARVGPVRRDRTGPRWGLYRGGTYCCARCSVALWRHLSAGGMDDRERRHAAGLRCLRRMRKGRGQWRAFPFWYTLSALIEIEGEPAREELRYAAPLLETSLRRAAGRNPFALRRQELARRALARV